MAVERAGDAGATPAAIIGDERARVTSAAVARIMIVGGGCRGRRLAGEMVAEGHAVRVTTRSEAGRADIERAGAECWVGTPDRLATLRGALDSVTILCWMLGSAVGSPQQLRALYTERLEFLLTQAIDTTVRGFVYEARGTTVDAETIDAGERVVRAVTERNSIPLAFLTQDAADADAWLRDGADAIRSLLTRA